MRDILDAITRMKRALRFFSLVSLTSPLLAQQLTADLVKGLEVRNVAGIFTSGRIADIAVDPENRSTWYIATASGGLWKTTNRGLNFQPVFDDQGSYSLGVVVVDPKNSDVVWLGTGENQAQRAIGYGDGVYKSTDAGHTWKKIGLPNSEHVAKIIIDPRNSNTVFVAAQGPLFSPGGDRGVYKSTDGGATWKAVLAVSENTGATDLDFDPRNPDVMYAATYQRRRNTSVIVAGGPESAIYKTTDAGAHWTKLKEGLPTADTGRIALAVSVQKPDTVYALISLAHNMSYFYRSDDAGAHWTKTYDLVERAALQDPEYYGEIFADPFQYDRVWIMDTVVRVTPDGGKTITPAGFQVHADNHALVFDPADPNHFLEGNDGGLYESYDHGHTWRHFTNIPVTQFYRVSTDNGLPFYNIYGGAQDNGSQGTPSRTQNRVGIRASDWMNTGGGDGFQSRADYADPDTVYTCSQQINCVRLDLKTGVSVSIRPNFTSAEVGAMSVPAGEGRTRRRRRGRRAWRPRNRTARPLGYPIHRQPPLAHAALYLRQSSDAKRRPRRYMEDAERRFDAQYRPRNCPGDGQGLGTGCGGQEPLHGFVWHRNLDCGIAREGRSADPGHGRRADSDFGRWRLDLAQDR